jgi:hypothetical protein
VAASAIQPEAGESAQSAAEDRREGDRQILMLRRRVSAVSKREISSFGRPLLRMRIGR